MARFRATIRGQRGQASRLGSAASGIVANINGWNSQCGERTCRHAEYVQRGKVVHVPLCGKCARKGDERE